MSEMRNPGPENGQDNSISRRKFLKGMLAMGVTAAYAGYGTKEYEHATSEKGIEEQAARMIVVGDLREKPVPKGGGVDSFYEESGWGNEYRIEIFEKAVELANKGINLRSLQENQPLMIPYKVKE